MVILKDMLLVLVSGYRTKMILLFFFISLKRKQLSIVNSLVSLATSLMPLQFGCKTFVFRITFNLAFTCQGDPLSQGHIHVKDRQALRSVYQHFGANI